MAATKFSRVRFFFLMRHPVCKTPIRSSLVCYCLIFPSSALSIRLPPYHVVFILLAALCVYVIISRLYVHDLLASQVLLLVHHIHSPSFASPHYCRCAASDRLSSISPSFYYLPGSDFPVFCASSPPFSLLRPTSLALWLHTASPGGSQDYIFEFVERVERFASCVAQEVVQLPERSSGWLSFSSTSPLSLPVSRPPVVSRPNSSSPPVGGFWAVCVPTYATSSLEK